MNLKGLEALHAHVPDFNHPVGVLRILALPIALIILTTAILNLGTQAMPVWSLVGVVAFGGLGFLLLGWFIRHRDEYKARFGPLAYRQAASRFGYPGVAIIAAAVAHIRSLPGPQIFPAGGTLVLAVLAWAFIAMGLLLFLRVMQIFGLDNLVMLYVYFPEESHLVEHKIYDILRHPAYAAAQCLAYGLALLNGGWLAIACALIFSLGLWAWVHWVEENELIERFGAGYAEYRQRVPAFWPRLHDLKGFFELLIAGS